MHMVIVLGSPRKKGNSETLASAVAAGLEAGGGTVEYIRLNELDIRPCQGCGGCDRTGNCVIRDDMTPVYEQVDRADRILLVSPVYFYGLTAQAKIFIDRMQARWSRKYNLHQPFRRDEGRRGYLLATAATTGARIFECSQLTARYLFDALDVACGESLLVSGVDDRGAAREREEEMARAREFGAAIARGEI